MDEIKTSDISAENRAEILNIIENFRLMDDTFMSKVFEDKACAELLLRVILNRGSQPSSFRKPSDPASQSAP